MKKKTFLEKQNPVREAGENSTNKPFNWPFICPL